MHLSLSVRAFIIISSIVFNLQTVVFSQPPVQGVKPIRASISGRVTIDGRPAACKRVLIAEVDMDGDAPGIGIGVGTQGRKFFSVVTDADGRYRLTGLAAGNYEANVELLRGYVPAGQQGQRSRSITIDQGKEARDIDFVLVRGGVITGRLTDSDGEPLIGARVVANKIDKVSMKSLDWTPLHYGDGTTDDRGGYRIYGLSAGSYRVSADGTRGGPMGGGWSNNSSRRYPRTYHPDVTEEERATIIEVKEGSEIGGINLNLGRKRPLYEVMGRVVDSGTGMPLSQGMINSYPIGPNGYPTESFPTTATIDSQGSFRIAGLSSGRYKLHYVSQVSDERKYLREGTIIEVKQGKITGVEVIARRTATIKGTVVFDASSNRALDDQLAGISIDAGSTRQEDNQKIYATYDSSPIGSDDSFSLSGLKPGIINLKFSSVPFGLRPRLLRIERDGVEITNAIAVKSGESIEGIRLIVAYGHGIVRGQINVEGGALPKGMKFSVSVSKQFPYEKHAEAKVNRKGQFVIEGLMDGEYIISAFNEWADKTVPAFHASQPIHVTGDRETQVTLTLRKSGGEMR
jgi:hypothetical protein